MGAVEKKLKQPANWFTFTGVKYHKICFRICNRTKEPKNQKCIEIEGFPKYCVIVKKGQCGPSSSTQNQKN